MGVAPRAAVLRRGMGVPPMSWRTRQRSMVLQRSKQSRKRLFVPRNQERCALACVGRVRPTLAGYRKPRVENPCHNYACTRFTLWRSWSRRVRFSGRWKRGPRQPMLTDHRGNRNRATCLRHLSIPINASSETIIVPAAKPAVRSRRRVCSYCSREVSYRVER